MEIKKIDILKYGPLKSIDFELEKGLNTIYGPNGSGKTLIIEAFHKLLIGKKEARKFQNAMVDEYPVGDVVTSNEDQDLTFDGKQSIEDFTDIHCKDLDQIFIVKDGNVRISEGREFYHDIIPRLIGLKLDDIGVVKQNLLQQGRMSSPGKLSDARDKNKAKSQLKDAKSVVTEITTWLEGESSELYVGYKYEISNLKKQKEMIKQEVGHLENAKENDELNRLEEHLNSIIDKKKELSEYEKKDFSPLEEKIKQYTTDPKFTNDYQKEFSTWTKYTFVYILLALFPILMVLIFPELILIAFISLLGFIGIAWCIIEIIKTNRKINEQRVLKNDINYNVKKLSLPSDNILDVVEFIEKQKNKNALLNEELQQSIGVLMNSALYNQINVQQFDHNQFSKSLDQARTKLNMTLPTDYDEQKYNKLKNTLLDIESRIEVMRDQGDKYIKSLQNLISICNRTAFDFENIIGKTFEWEITNIESLEKLLEWLNQLIDVIENDMKINEEAHNIFEKIYENETKKIAEYFNTNTKISEITREITNGFFKNVTYDSNEGIFLLERESNISQNIDQLSRGELSQLYFAIRLALGSKCLEKGFMFMEDPFLASDDERLEEQLKILNSFIASGWQVLIFTAKNNVKEKIIENGGTLVKELDRIVY